MATLLAGWASGRSNSMGIRASYRQQLRGGRMADNQPVTATTVRPLRVLGAIAVGAGLIVVATFLIHEGGYQYRLWRAGGVWCATMEPDGTITKSFGADACGY